ncbi:MAG TPA: ThuA domain-containing protein [Kofleriaceae bacterium]|nr:ThuA domain-containing protein [Kofleriaceae bacterium]
MRAAAWKLVGLVGLAACAAPDPDPPGVRDAVIDGQCTGDGGPRVLVYSRETLWMHPSTPVARDALLAMCATEGFSVIASSDPLVFDRDRLADIDVVVFAVTSGNVLDDVGRAAFEPWVRGGGGVVGIHSASATEYDWPFFVELIGARFRTHPPMLLAGDVTVEDPASPVVAGLDARWPRTDEWYQFYETPDQIGGHVVLALDEASIAGDGLPADQRSGYHPIAWTDDHLGGRMFYTAMGHTPESYSEPAFLRLLAQGITWAARR